MNPVPEASWRILEWDSEFFGFRIARAFVAQSAADGVRIVEECARHKVRCLYFLAEAGDIATIRLLEQQGFGFADVRLTLIHQSPGAGQSPEIPGIRRARAEDVTALECIARRDRARMHCARQPSGHPFLRRSAFCARALRRPLRYLDCQELQRRVCGRGLRGGDSRRWSGRLYHVQYDPAGSRADRTAGSGSGSAGRRSRKEADPPGACVGAVARRNQRGHCDAGPQCFGRASLRTVRLRRRANATLVPPLV